MKYPYFFLLILLLPPLTQAETYINELMYNPEGSDNNKEYLEIYSENNLQDYTIEDLYSSDTLTLIKEVNNSNFSLIVEEEFNHTDINANIYSVGATIGNNLNNDRDVIVLRDPEGELIDALSYTEKLGANNNGLSLCKLPDFIGIIKECTPTPGKPNTAEIDYKIRINEFLPDPEGYDDAPMPNGEWIELYNYGTIEMNLEDFKLKDNFGHKIEISNNHVTGPTIIEPDNYLIIYANGKFGFLNNEDFEKIILLDNQGNTIDIVTYDESQEGTSWSFIEDKWLKSQPTPGKENPISKELELNSKIKIETIYLGTDEKAKWGDSIRVKLIVYKGNTTKESVQAWIERGLTTVSKRTRFNMHKRFTETEFTIPIQIHPNCKNTYSDGDYTLIVQGLNTEDEEKIKIQGLTSSLCVQNKYAKSEDVSFELLEAPTEIFTGDEFTTKLRINNQLDTKQQFKVWNEIKDGKKIITNTSTNIYEIIDIPAGSSGIINLVNEVKYTEETGDHTLYIKILEEGKKMPQSISKTIKINQKEDNFFESDIKTDIPTSKVVYASKSKKQLKLSMYFFIFLIALMAIYGITRK